MVVDVPVPNAEVCAPSACVNTASTPLYAESSTPPSVIDDERFARTARTLFWSGFPLASTFGSGKFCTFVATYVASEMPPAGAYSTQWDRFASGGKTGMVTWTV